MSIGRDRSPEDIVDDIVNQSGEGFDDLLEDTELDEGDLDLDDFEGLDNDDLDDADFGSDDSSESDFESEEDYE